MVLIYTINIVIYLPGKPMFYKIDNTLIFNEKIISGCRPRRATRHLVWMKVNDKNTTFELSYT